MTYQQPEILASYFTSDIVGTSLGYSSTCVLDNDPMPDCNHNG